MMTMMTMMLLRKGDDIASSHPEASVSFQIGMEWPELSIFKFPT